MTSPYYSDDSVTLFHGDSLELLTRDILGYDYRLGYAEPEWPTASVDSVVTDPPYGISFMGREWDQPDHGSERRGGSDRSFKAGPVGVDHNLTTERSASMHAGQYDLSRSAMRSFQAWCEEWATECLRVLKPGGHLLAFGGARMWHRLACGIEDAGFEIRDSVADLTGRESAGLIWLFGSGFPKSMDVSKAIDKAAGAEREVIGSTSAGRSSLQRVSRIEHGYRENLTAVTPDSIPITAPATDASRQWEGWGTALKPAFEPIVVGRKPFPGTVAANVLKHGTGALNIDACRVQHGEEVDLSTVQRQQHRHDGDENWRMRPGHEQAMYAPGGRWPTNVVLGEDAAAELDKQTGVSQSRIGKPRSAGSGDGWGMTATGAEYDDQGGSSRFFPVFRYEAKAPSAERPSYIKDGAGTGRVTGLGGKIRQCNVCETRAIESGASEPSCGHGDFRWEEPTTDTGSRVAHPTVKPLDLMRWLVRLVTPAGGTVLEPFAGSGTTAEACVLEHVKCIAIEREADYLPLIVARLTKPIQVGFDFGGAA